MGWQVDITDAKSLTAEDWAQWDEMRTSNPALASPYFDPAFTRMASEVSPRSAVAAFRRDGHVRGYFPFQRRGAAVLPLGAPMNDYHGVIGRAGDVPSLKTVAALLKAPRFSVGAWVGSAAVGTPRRTMMATMPGGFDAWYAERRSTWGKYFKDKERARRSLETELGPIRVEIGLKDPELLDHLIGLKRDQYRRTGRHDIFACGWTRDLLHRLMTGEAEAFGGSLAAMWAGDRLTAVEYSLHGGEHYHFWFPAYEPKLARCSPGILLSLETMRMASARGSAVFDFGFGGEGYKKYFCDASQEVREAVILAPGLRTGVAGAVGGLMALAGTERAVRLGTSVQRRWSAIEACEVNTFARARGVAQAAGSALAKLRSEQAAA